MSGPCVAIVDPYSSGALLADELRAQGAKCIAVESSRRVPAAMRSRYRPESFAVVVKHDADPAGTERTLQAHAPTWVIAGFESGVELADALSEGLGLPTNGTAQSAARRNKYHMWKSVRSRGLLTARHFRSSRLDELLRWIDHTATWPVILKPERSVASDCVSRCVSPEEVRRACDAILSRPTVLGDRNDAVVAQECLRGTEYVVDVVSFAGQRKATAFWQYGRSPGDTAIGYDAMTLLPYVGERQQSLQAYAYRVLDALGIAFGPAHCEIMWTAGGPALVEVGARLSAGVNAVLSRVCGGISQLDETVDAILRPAQFLASLDSQPVLERHAVNVFLMPSRAGRLTRVNGLEVLENLHTLYSMSVSVTPGRTLPRVAGIVTLVSADMRAIERDVATIRALERKGLFEVDHAANC